MSPTEEARRQRRITNVALVIMGVCMSIVIVCTIVIIGLLVTGNTTTSRLDDSTNLTACRAAATARLNAARTLTDHAQNSILLGIGDPEAIDQAQERVRAADRHLSEVELEYQAQYELSNKDKSEFLDQCRARGDI